ncbi:MAG: hypothetical protein P0Y53_09995 [Candidatus Pseudobacter hemicellulosilyticus]|uniref:histidine kinase n=1 Tax=Candidatus Pseudobacter hemicellulosilyticus TaxID=3121375 RepID=A0AAJ6BI09_9BACT|nr:MAG: hypothetical protein P0Y53_09995 [Pseudobacter sp.]
MLFDKLVDYFLPAAIRRNKTHPRFEEFRVIVSSAVLALPILAVFPLFLLSLGKAYLGYYLNLALVLCLLFSIRSYGHYRLPMSLLAVVTYFIIYDFIKDTGLIYSTHMGVMHVYLLAAIWTDKKWGWIAIITNVLIFIIIYRQTIGMSVAGDAATMLGSPLYALILHCFITVFLGGLLAYEQMSQEKNRQKIRSLQDQKISLLDEAVKQRTEQLSNMRQVMAADFHDETGNMLSAITRQAALLKLKLQDNHSALPIADSIIRNSNDLYARSKDFLWNLNHNSDDPMELFNYLTAHGQQFCNQFDIAFSSVAKNVVSEQKKLAPFAALNLIFIFKEAMTNITKHADANEVSIEMQYFDNKVIYIIQDNGRWKQADARQSHYGLMNIERRCEKNAFGFRLFREEGTRLEITAPIYPFFS